MSSKEFQNELYALGSKLWLKLEGLPKAEPLEIVFFFIIILFIGTHYLDSDHDCLLSTPSLGAAGRAGKRKLLFFVTVLSMMIIACSVCCARCCNGTPVHKARRIQVRPADCV